MAWTMLLYMKKKEGVADTIILNCALLQFIHRGPIHSQLSMVSREAMILSPRLHHEESSVMWRVQHSITLNDIYNWQSTTHARACKRTRKRLVVSKNSKRTITVFFFPLCRTLIYIPHQRVSGWMTLHFATKRVQYCCSSAGIRRRFIANEREREWSYTFRSLLASCRRLRHCCQINRLLLSHALKHPTEFKFV